MGLAPLADLTPYIRERQLELYALDKLLGIAGRALERTNGIGRENLKNKLRRQLGEALIQGRATFDWAYKKGEHQA